jgi:tetratricopeptide (TPR) repeat protein
MSTFKQKCSSIYLLSYSLLISSFLGAQNLEQAEHMADSAFAAANFSFAAHTYKRVIFFKKEAVDFNLYYKLGLCQSVLGKKEEALQSLDRAYFLTQESKLQNEAIFSKVQLLIANRDWKAAQLELYNLEPANEAAIKRRAFFLGIAAFAQEQYEEARPHFASLLTDSNSVAKLDSLLQLKKLHSPNPQTAQYLSVFIPGAGQFYAGDYEAGLNSLLLTAAFLGGAYYLAQLYTPVDALITVIPWITRYYMGGYIHSEEIALRKREVNRNAVLNEIVALIPSS